ncbi:MAG: exonuclease domain-containing protein [Candidatus Kaiserbacteria bacterium]|nr:exonuclease domain-containing protein [Candidatus Kaiserbacteria bacterium]
MRIIFFDTETTGNSETDRLCQLAVKERYIDEPLVNATYKPPVPISIESMAIHHITERMVANKPAFKDAPEYSSLKDLFESNETISVAHNAAFDLAMFAREGVVPKRTICTYKLAYALDPNDELPNYRLQYLRYLFDLDVDIEAHAHDAFGDVLVLEALFNRFMEQMKERHGTEEAALDAMLTISAQPLLFTTLRFGKYNGKRIDEVAKTDPSYLQWLLDQKKQNPVGEEDWIYTLEHYLKPSGDPTPL